MVATSPPYWGLRDYGIQPQDWPEVSFSPVAGLPPITIPAQQVCLGLEVDPWAFVGHLVLVSRALRRVLRDDGVLFLNLGDSYAGNGTAFDDSSSTLVGSKQSGRVGGSRPSKRADGLKAKDLCGIPWRVAFALQADGWHLRSDVIWEKPSCMPESCRDRPTKSHEYVFLLSKGPHYFWDKAAVAEPDSGQRSGNGFVGRQGGSARVGPLSGGQGTTHSWQPGAGRNLRTVWRIGAQRFRGTHYATWPEALVERMIRAGSRPGDPILDPFGGSGTTGQVARSLGRAWTLIEANPSYAADAKVRVESPTRAELATKPKVKVCVVRDQDGPQIALFRRPDTPSP